MTSLGREKSLVAGSPCTIAGTNVTGTFTNYNNGSYGFRYVVQPGIGDYPVNGIPIALTLVDPLAGAAVAGQLSGTVSLSSAVFTNNSVAIDTTPPLAVQTCGVDNNTVGVSENITFCVSCGSGELYGCTGYFSINGSAPLAVSTNASVGNVASATFYKLKNRNSQNVTMWTVDAAGNVGPTLVLLFSVDLFAPYTIWREVPTTLSNQSTAVFAFDCSEVRLALGAVEVHPGCLRLGGAVCCSVLQCVAVCCNVLRVGDCVYARDFIAFAVVVIAARLFVQVLIRRCSDAPPWQQRRFWLLWCLWQLQCGHAAGVDAAPSSRFHCRCVPAGGACERHNVPSAQRDVG